MTVNLLMPKISGQTDNIVVLVNILVPYGALLKWWCTCEKMLVKFRVTYICFDGSKVDGFPALATQTRNGAKTPISTDELNYF